MVAELGTEAKSLHFFLPVKSFPLHLPGLPSRQSFRTGVREWGLGSLGTEEPT